jgi:hypothetical protein
MNAVTLAFSETMKTCRLLVSTSGLAPESQTLFLSEGDVAASDPPGAVSNQVAGVRELSETCKVSFLAQRFFADSSNHGS